MFTYYIYTPDNVGPFIYHNLKDFLKAYKFLGRARAEIYGFRFHQTTSNAWDYKENFVNGKFERVEA